jgi:endonuclease/exonuclease/phosphatase family metal-dependent hydrolase
MAGADASAQEPEKPAADFRVITFNTAVGNPKIKTDQRDFLKLPFYREIIEGAESAPILALQEVGPAQAKALKEAAKGGHFSLIHISRPGQGNALLVPARFKLLRRRRRYFIGSQLRALVMAVWRAIFKHEPLNYRQYLELRMWIGARLRDEDGGRQLTVFNTHLSGEGPLRLAQAKSLLERAHRARRHGPVLLAGDLNVRAGASKNPADAEVRALFAPLENVAATATDPRRPTIDWLLADGLQPVSSRLYTDAALTLPGLPSADLISDHYAKEATLRFGS